MGLNHQFLLQLRQRFKEENIKHKRKDIIMKEVMKIKLSTTNDVKEFVNAAMLCSCQIDVRHGRYIEDGK